MLRANKLEGYRDIAITDENLYRFYEEYFSYFNTLDETWKKKFVQRCLHFIDAKLIYGADNFVPDNKVKCIIAASAVQLTLGLDEWMLGHFDTIIVHPEEFHYKPTGQLSKGQTNIGGYIHLSWKSFINGYLVPDDNINLGLHEFTHALRFNPINGSDQDYFIEHYFNRWLAAANEAYADLRSERKTIFRKYGGTNLNEFMSVCIEHFFESPEEIKQAYPFLYYSTAILLNQLQENGKTLLNVRRHLFETKNNLTRPLKLKQYKTKITRTSSFIVMWVTAIPLILTAIYTGMSFGTVFLAVICLLFYLRYDFNFISVDFHGNALTIQKGNRLFRNRFKRTIPLSQLISLRTNEGASYSDLEVIYYDQHNGYFYSEVIESGVSVDHDFLTDLWQNKIALFRSKG